MELLIREAAPRRREQPLLQQLPGHAHAVCCADVRRNPVVAVHNFALFGDNSAGHPDIDACPVPRSCVHVMSGRFHSTRTIGVAHVGSTCEQCDQVGGGFWLLSQGADVVTIAWDLCRWAASSDFWFSCLVCIGCSVRRVNRCFRESTCSFHGTSCARRLGLS